MIRRIIIALWLLIAPFPAVAQINSCLDLTSSYSASFYQGTTVASMIYLVPYQYLIVQMRPGIYGPYTEFINVPQSTAQLFANTSTSGGPFPSPDTYFLQSILPVFHEVLLNQNGCPMLNEAGNVLLGK